MLFDDINQTVREDGQVRILSNYKNKNIIRSLQAQAVSTGLLPIKRASRSALHPCRGSATVETALALPIFLSALCFLIMIGQLLLVEGEVRHALAKTAQVCARQEALKAQVDGDGLLSAMPVQFIEANAAFYSFLQSKDLCTSCIVGGSHGVLVTVKGSADQGYIRVTANYILRIPLPFFRGKTILRSQIAKRRVYSGYFPKKGAEDDNDPIVYITENGSVYHTSLSCTHISLRISASAMTRNMLKARGLRACEKCTGRDDNSQAYYITADGDCYHRSITCSGLTRTVRTARLSEVGGMRMCSRCGMRKAG